MFITIAKQEAKLIWEQNNKETGDLLWVLSGEYEVDSPLFTTVLDEFPEHENLFFMPFEVPLDNFLEIHYEVVAFFYNHQENKFLEKVENRKGRGGMWELAKDFTKEFQNKHEKTIWGLELDFYDTLESFLIDKTK